MKRRGKSPPGFRVSEIVRQTPCGARQSRGKGCLSALSIQRKPNGRVTSGNSRISVATVYRSAQHKLGEINDRQPAQAGHRIRLTPQKGGPLERAGLDFSGAVHWRTSTSQSIEKFLSTRVFSNQYSIYTGTSSSIFLARVKSLSVNPPAEWVDKTNRTLFHRISISG